MTFEELFAFVKPKVKGVTSASNYYDGDIKFCIAEVLSFMEGAGIPESAITEKNAGVVVVGVNDIFDLNGGTTDFSPYFYKRVTQLEAQLSAKAKKEAAANV